MCGSPASRSCSPHHSAKGIRAMMGSLCKHSGLLAGQYMSSTGLQRAVSFVDTLNLDSAFLTLDTFPCIKSCIA